MAEHIDACGPKVLFASYSVINMSLSAHLGQRLSRGHLVSEHEVGEDTGGAPGHPHLAVDEDLAPGRQSLVDEVHHLVEIDRNVGLRHVHQLNTLVGDAPWLVVFLNNTRICENHMCLCLFSQHRVSPNSKSHY